MQSPCFNDTSIHLIEGARAERSQEQHGGHDGKDSSRGNRAGAGRNRHFARKSRGTDAEAYRVCVGSGPGAGDKRRDGGGIEQLRSKMEDGRWKMEDRRCRRAASVFCLCRSSIAVNPSRNNKRGNRPKPISPFVVEAAYFFFAAFFFPAFFLAFFLAAMVQSPVKEWIALAIPRWIAGSQNRFLAALTTRPLRGS